MQMYSQYVKTRQLKKLIGGTIVFTEDLQRHPAVFIQLDLCLACKTSSPAGHNPGPEEFCLCRPPVCAPRIPLSYKNKNRNLITFTPIFKPVDLQPVPSRTREGMCKVLNLNCRRLCCLQERTALEV